MSDNSQIEKYVAAISEQIEGRVRLLRESAAPYAVKYAEGDKPEDKASYKMLMGAAESVEFIVNPVRHLVRELEREVRRATLNEGKETK